VRLISATFDTSRRHYTARDIDLRRKMAARTTLVDVLAHRTELSRATIERTRSFGQSMETPRPWKTRTSCFNASRRKSPMAAI